VCDSKGIISKERTDLNKEKLEILAVTNKENISGNLATAIT
jgi:malate dehydrogenase (oxaloacetate-decarboxylating)